MHDLAVRPPASLDEPPLDWTMCFEQRLKTWKKSRKPVELLLGTRGFQVPASRRGSFTFVAIYGSQSILEFLPLERRARPPGDLGGRVAVR
jgi:hypothetical protein